MPSVFITCAVPGGGDTVHKSPHVPVTPEQIANSAIEAWGWLGSFLSARA